MANDVIFSNDEIISLAFRMLETQLHLSGDILSMPDMVKKYLVLKLAQREHESFGILFLDIKKRLISDEELFRGTLNHTSVYPREVAKSALEYNANSVVLYHNHPSGDCDPSAADIDVTRRLMRVLHWLDVKVVDHIIVGGVDTYSFHENGTLPTLTVGDKP
jgi:DNA repair protein RadC